VVNHAVSKLPVDRIAANAREAAIWSVIEGVPDPEIPVLSVVDLGIVRSVVCDGDAAPQVAITPTYSGCPATAVIRTDIERALDAAGHGDAHVYEVLSPPWSSDWLSENGRRKLREFGIAPPAEQVSSPRRLFGAPKIACPRCGNTATERVSEFGSTPCKAHYRCTSCREPFDYFKCI
jgi:ring-1,2-phenylacetyl-CoA epoxidase subunit PaaD